MALDLDNEILKDFVDQVIDRIEILEGPCPVDPVRERSCP